MSRLALVTCALLVACNASDRSASPDAAQPGSDGPGVDSGSDAAAPLAFTALSTTDKETLTAVWGASSTDLWVTTNNDGGGYGRIMHSSDGATFTDAGSSGAFTGLYGVWGTASDDVWIVGGDAFAESDERSLLHWDGASWTPNDHATGVDGLYYAGVFGTASNDVWFFGEQALTHWNGATFTSTGTQTTHLTSAWGASPTDYTFVGDNGAVQNLNGANDTEIGDGHTLRAIAGASANDLWAVGDGGLAMHFTGASWTKVDTGTSYALDALWVVASDDIYAVGAAGTVLHWDGTAWHAIALDSQYALTSFYGAWGIPGQALWIVGDAGTVLHAAL